MAIIWAVTGLCLLSLNSSHPVPYKPSFLIFCLCFLISGKRSNLVSCLDMEWRKQWHPTPVLSPGKSHGQRSLVGHSPWGREESDTTEWLTFSFHFHVLEKEMATHSTVLAWIIPGMGEPCGLLSMGSHRVGHNWSDLAAAAAAAAARRGSPVFRSVSQKHYWKLI